MLDRLSGNANLTPHQNSEEVMILKPTMVLSLRWLPIAANIIVANLFCNKSLSKIQGKEYLCWLSALTSVFFLFFPSLWLNIDNHKVISSKHWKETALLFVFWTKKKAHIWPIYPCWIKFQVVQTQSVESKGGGT